VGTALVRARLGILAVRYVSPRQFWWLLASLFAVGGWEWARFIAIEAPWQRLLAALLVAILVIIGAAVASQQLLVIGAGGALLWILALLWLALGRLEANQQPLARLSKGLFGLLLIVTGALALGALYGQTHGRYWLLLLLLLIWAADVGAYLAGRTLGRHKLAPRVSPGKTWEGVAGGVILATGLALLASHWIDLQPGQLVRLLAVCLATVAISVVGDLFISLMKRQAGLKDAGRIFPGHGGVLDRFDSLIAAAPIFLLGLQFLGLTV